MRLQKLQLYNYRNYEDLKLDLEGEVFCLLGKNGSGKTNLLDAIYYLSFTKSFLNATDSFNVRTGESVFSIKGHFVRDNREAEVFCSMQAGSKKIVRENGNDYQKLSHHIGKYPVVLVAPNDIELIWDGSEVRRKFVDGLISQIDGAYLEQLIVYNHYLKMRNAALKQFAERGKTDYDLLETYNRPLAAAGDFIAQTRRQFLDVLRPALQKFYRFLSNNPAETTDVQYKTDADQATMAALLHANLARDLAMQRTSTGIHRDDFSFLLDGQELKRFGSQGQQKSFLIGLKLAEFEIIHQKKGFKPLLLLDDIFDKLDDDRIARLIQLINEETFGQLFITDARPDRTRELVRHVTRQMRKLLVEAGTVRPA
ncbi:MAG: DNA replication/repair protein RecF [Bacteroidota bacterium]